MPSPGDILTLRIEDIVYRGSGLARADGMVVFVPGTAVGELVRARVAALRKRFCEAELLEVLDTAVNNMKPRVEVKSRRVGGASYQVPVEIKPARQLALALRWLVTYAAGRRGMGMPKAVAAELLDAYNNTGNVIKKRDDTHKMAQANRAFAHYAF